MADDLIIRTAESHEADAVAELIHRSTNRWYQQRFGQDIFTCSPKDVRLFCDVYETLDPGQCLIAQDSQSGAIAGSCFVHPRQTHVSLGIMNVDPDHFGRGVARRLLKTITDQADAAELPVRLISSAMNLDSYSLYNRAGFVPFAVYQDMLIEPKADGVMPEDETARRALGRVRPARPTDVPQLAQLEHALLGISRPNDIAYFIDNAMGYWSVSVIDDDAGQPAGYLASIDHPACRIIGPGAARDDTDAIALLSAQLELRAGTTMLVLAPADRPAITAQLYRWGARNCEIHVAQQRLGPKPEVKGVVLPSFLPESA